MYQKYKSLTSKADNVRTLQNIHEIFMCLSVILLCNRKWNKWVLEIMSNGNCRSKHHQIQKTLCNSVGTKTRYMNLFQEKTDKHHCCKIATAYKKNELEKKIKKCYFHLIKRLNALFLQEKNCYKYLLNLWVFFFFQSFLYS